MCLYWVSAIVMNDGDKKPWLCAMSEGHVELSKALEEAGRLSANHSVLSVWIDLVNNEGFKETVFHACYL